MKKTFIVLLRDMDNEWPTVLEVDPQGGTPKQFEAAYFDALARVKASNPQEWNIDDALSIMAKTWQFETHDPICLYY